MTPYSEHILSISLSMAILDIRVEQKTDSESEPKSGKTGENRSEYNRSDLNGWVPVIPPNRTDKTEPNRLLK